VSRIAGSSGDVRLFHVRRQYVPLASVIAACLLAAFPIVVSTPIVPDFAFLVLIAWRLLRPELWTATTPLPLGLFNDLVAGHPLGQSMALWTITFLIFDIIDARIVWRDYLMDWLAAALATGFYIIGAWYIGYLLGNRIELAVLLPQIGLSILAYPLIARIVLGIDRWRLLG
jgi:rod shape-determining protein MreD